MLTLSGQYQQNHDGVGQPVGLGGVGQRGVGGDGKRTESEGAVFEADGAEDGEAESHQGHGQDEGNACADGALGKQ